LQTEARKLLAAVANCSEQVVNQNTNVAAEVCKVAQKRTSGLTVILLYITNIRQNSELCECVLANNHIKHKVFSICFALSFQFLLQLLCMLLAGFVRVLEILESPGVLFWHFPGLESPGTLMQVLESPGNLSTLVIKFSLKTILCSIIFGFFVLQGIIASIIVHLGALEKSM